MESYSTIPERENKETSSSSFSFWLKLIGFLSFGILLIFGLNYFGFNINLLNISTKNELLGSPAPDMSFGEYDDVLTSDISPSPDMSDMSDMKKEIELNLNGDIFENGNGINVRYDFSFGYIPAGNNIEIKTMTVNEAKAYAITLGPECIGFTMRSTGNYNTPVTVWFKKNSRAVFGESAGTWQTFLKPQYNEQDGYLQAGYNIEIKTMSVNDAKGYALTLPYCTGFTYQDTNDNDKKITIWFKRDITKVWGGAGNAWNTMLLP